MGRASGQPFSTSLLDHFDNIQPPLLMAAWYHPDPIDSSAAIDLTHKVKAVNIFIKIRVIPVGVAILMPGHRGPQPGIFNK